VPWKVFELLDIPSSRSCTCDHYFITSTTTVTTTTTATVAATANFTPTAGAYAENYAMQYRDEALLSGGGDERVPGTARERQLHQRSYDPRTSQLHILLPSMATLVQDKGKCTGTVTDYR
jgi:hypothetical protein